MSAAHTHQTGYDDGPRSNAAIVSRILYSMRAALIRTATTCDAKDMSAAQAEHRLLGQAHSTE